MIFDYVTINGVVAFLLLSKRFVTCFVIKKVHENTFVECAELLSGVHEAKMVFVGFRIFKSSTNWNKIFERRQSNISFKLIGSFG